MAAPLPTVLDGALATHAPFLIFGSSVPVADIVAQVSERLGPVEPLDVRALPPASDEL